MKNCPLHFAVVLMLVALLSPQGSSQKQGFQIVRMRSDLLVTNPKIGLDQLTTETTCGEVRLQDVPNALWLPSDVAVSIGN